MTKLWCKQHFFNNSPTFLLYQMRERERERWEISVWRKTADCSKDWLLMGYHESDLGSRTKPFQINLYTYNKIRAEVWGLGFCFVFFALLFACYLNWARWIRNVKEEWVEIIQILFVSAPCVHTIDKVVKIALQIIKLFPSFRNPWTSPKINKHNQEHDDVYAE